MRHSHPALQMTGHKANVCLSPNYSLKADWTGKWLRYALTLWSSCGNAGCVAILSCNLKKKIISYSTPVLIV